MTEPIVALEVRVSVLEERMRGRETALQLQGNEYERRLAELNHAHAKQVKDQATYISQDKFEGFLAETHVWRGKIDKTLDAMEGRYSGIGTIREISLKIAPIALSFATLILLLLRLKS